jgi:hypothetical protein
MTDSTNPLKRFFGVVIKGQTYLNLLYLLLAFPLGIAYLIFLITGIVLGVPLTLLLVGFLILAIVALGWWVFASFERLLAIWLLRIEIRGGVGKFHKLAYKPGDLEKPALPVI